MLFSILIANFNNGHFFEECYQSIISQTYTNWEAVIVDDCSTDDSVNTIQKIIGDDKRFKLYLNKKNQGCGYTKKKCADLANGEIAGFLDPDDILTNDAIQIMVSGHKKHPHISIITSKYEEVDLKMNSIKTCTHASSIPENKSYLTYGKGALTHFATFKKSHYFKSDGIAPEMKRAVDQDLYFKMEEQGSHLFVNKVLYCYRVHANNISRNKNLFKAKYWHFYAILKAYKRRKKYFPEIDNFSEMQIKKYKSNYYMERFEKAKNENNWKAQFYFVFKSILAYPNYKCKLKMKALIS